MGETLGREGSFTLPGEAGYEELTLALAKRWGADTIRDSDGTILSDKILASGYDIYSTICLVRADNEWAKAHRDKLQQACLMSFPVAAENSKLRIEPLAGYFHEQFALNLDEDPAEWWQAFDRTTGEEVPRGCWEADRATGAVTIRGALPFHEYSVNFFAYRIWEEISMYNHVTNSWGDREHLMPIDPIYPEARETMRRYLALWLEERPHTKVVRFTSMFYNFFWPWGDDPKRRFILNDCGSYEFSVSPEAIRLFEKAKGYRPASEDFVNQGRYWSSHTVPGPVYRDWIDFMSLFVVETTRSFVDMVHAAGKKAYVFYNDHWLGLEPATERFEKAGFDGMIDGIFSAFEARKVAATRGVTVRELRLHPYFFPTGVNGAPTFLEGGDPKRECQTYWLDIRRALLRKPVDRIGFGGYLHLVEGKPEFIEYVAALAQEFRGIKELHRGGAPWTAPIKVAVLTAWGGLRAWMCCGHFNRGNFYNEIIESLAGLPIEVAFLSFEDILTSGIPKDIDVVVNAGVMGDSWTGGSYWERSPIVEALSSWIAAGGAFIGAGESSAAPASMRRFRLAPVLGVDREMGLTRNHSRYAPDPIPLGEHFMTRDLKAMPDFGRDMDGVYALGGETKVLAREGNSIKIAARECASGRTAYFSGYKHSPANARLLHRAVFWAARRELEFGPWTCSNIETECAYYPASGELAVINLTDRPQETSVRKPDGGSIQARLPAFGMSVVIA